MTPPVIEKILEPLDLAEVALGAQYASPDPALISIAVRAQDSTDSPGGRSCFVVVMIHAPLLRLDISEISLAEWAEVILVLK